MKLLDEVAKEAGLNTKIPHEGETIFGSTKRKFNLLPGDDSDSHRHDRVNYSVPKLDKVVSSFQSQQLVRSVVQVSKSISFVKSYSPSLS